MTEIMIGTEVEVAGPQGPVPATVRATGLHPRDARTVARVADGTGRESVEYVSGLSVAECEWCGTSENLTDAVTGTVYPVQTCTGEADAAAMHYPCWRASDGADAGLDYD